MKTKRKNSTSFKQEQNPPENGAVKLTKWLDGGSGSCGKMSIGRKNFNKFHFYTTLPYQIKKGIAKRNEEVAQIVRESIELCIDTVFAKAC